MWCRNSFKGIPIFLPVKFLKGIFYASGNFCSFNCCKSYLFDLKINNIWELNSLLNLYYFKLTNNKDEIKLSPHWKKLKQCGGNFTIKQFRQNSSIDNINYYINNCNLYILGELIEKVNNNIVNNTKKDNNQLRLKRTKNIINKNNNLLSMIDII